MSVGSIASRTIAAIAPATSRSSAVTGAPSRVCPTTMRPRRARRSFRSDASPSTAITSDADVMSKPDCLGTPFFGPPSPTWISRSARSFMSTTRFQLMRSVSTSSGLSSRHDVSSAAARRLFAAPTAWKSPVRWRLKSSIGTTWLCPPPAAPPLIPNTGPIDGWRIVHTARLPSRFSASDRPIVWTVLPSPAGVGVIAVTRT